MNNSSPALFATRLSALRREGHWKQEAIAIHVGVTRSAYTKWETGVACPRFEELCKLAELFLDIHRLSAGGQPGTASHQQPGGAAHGRAVLPPARKSSSGCCCRPESLYRNRK